MSNGEYYTVFDVSKAGFKCWQFSVFGLIFVVIGLVLPILIRKGLFEKAPPDLKKWFPRFFLGFAVFWTLITFIGTFDQYRSAVHAMQGNQVVFVEGVVREFKPMPYEGHAMESFVVQGIKFEYSDFVVTAGFNQTASHGGPIREGLPVKIWHLNGEILRLDIRKDSNAPSPPRLSP